MPLNKLPLAKMKQNETNEEITQKEKGKKTQTSEPSKSKLSLLLKNLKASDKTCGLVLPDIPKMGKKENYRAGKCMYFCTHNKCRNITQGEGALCELHHFLSYKRGVDLDGNFIDAETFPNMIGAEITVFKGSKTVDTDDDGNEMEIYTVSKEQDTLPEGYEFDDFITFSKDYYKDYKASYSKCDYSEDLIYPVIRGDEKCEEIDMTLIQAEDGHFYEPEQTSTENVKGKKLTVWRCQHAAVMRCDSVRTGGKGGGYTEKRPRESGGRGRGGHGRNKHHHEITYNDSDEPLDFLTRRKLETLLYMSDCHYIPQPDTTKILSNQSFVVDPSMFKFLLKEKYNTIEYNYLTSNRLLIHDVMTGLYCGHISFKCLLYITACLNPEDDTEMDALEHALVGNTFTYEKNLQDEFRRTYSLVTLSDTPVGFLGYQFRHRDELFRMTTKLQADTFLKASARLKQHLYEIKRYTGKTTEVGDIFKQVSKRVHEFYKQLICSKEEGWDKVFFDELDRRNPVADFQPIMTCIREINKETNRLDDEGRMDVLRMFVYWSWRLSQQEINSEMFVYMAKAADDDNMFKRRNAWHNNYELLLTLFNDNLSKPGLQTAKHLLHIFTECVTYGEIQRRRHLGTINIEHPKLWDNEKHSKERFLNTISYVRTVCKENEINLHNELSTIDKECADKKVFTTNEDPYNKLFEKLFEHKYKMFELTDTQWIHTVKLLNLEYKNEKEKLKNYQTKYKDWAHKGIVRHLNNAHEHISKGEYVKGIEAFKDGEGLTDFKWATVLGQKIKHLDTTEKSFKWLHSGWGARETKGHSGAAWDIIQIDTNKFEMLHLGQEVYGMVYNRHTLVGQFIVQIMNGNLHLVY